MKKEHFIPILLIALAIAFIFVSLMLFLSNEDKYWIKQKLRIGAIIISFTSSMSSCIPFGTCYLESITDSMYLENTQNNEIHLDIIKTNKIKGWIELPAIKYYSFRITDTNYIEVQRDNIFADDGAFNEDYEEFTIKVDITLNAGKYFLYLFTQKKEDQPDSVKSGYSYKLIISK